MDVTAGDQNFRGKTHGFRKVVRDGSQRRQKEIAETVAFQPGSFIEAMLEELGKQRFILAEGDDAVPDIARRKHVEFFAQASAGTAVVAYGNHGAKIPDDGRGRRRSHQFRGSEREEFEPLKKSGKPGAATDGDNAQAAFAGSLVQSQGRSSFGLHRVNLDCGLKRFVFPEGAFR